MKLDVKIEELFINRTSIACYPYMTATFLPLVKINRDETREVELYLCDNANKKWDWINEVMKSVNGVSMDNKQTFVIDDGIVIQFYDRNTYIGSVNTLKIGRFF